MGGVHIKIMENELNKLKGWVSGFLDGEGCFHIAIKRYPGSSRFYYRPELTVQVRSDDEASAHALIQALGCGKIYQRKAQEASRTRGFSKPSIQMFWRSKKELLAVIELLDEFPLRGKKSRDYEIWKKAVVTKLSDKSEPEKKVILASLKEESTKIKQFV